MNPENTARFTPNYRRRLYNVRLQLSTPTLFGNAAGKATRRRRRPTERNFRVVPKHVSTSAKGVFCLTDCPRGMYAISYRMDRDRIV
jgi:hypothetical protein